MCPSYRATRDEVHSTRGRAKVLTEMFQGEISPASWRNEEVREALDLCLSCKACASECPTHVDMATYKSEFYSHYYRGRLRPRAMYFMGLLPWAARVTTAVPALAQAANAVLGARTTSRWAKRAAGLSTERAAPRFYGADSFRATLGREKNEALGRPAPRSDVVVFADTFTDSFNPRAGLDLVGSLEALGQRVAVPAEWACCGRTLYDFGMLDLAKRTLTRLVKVLSPWVEAGVPVVVPEPSCLAAFRDELPNLLANHSGAAALARLARGPAEHVVETGLAVQGAGPGPGRGQKAVVHPHCHQRAIIGTAPDKAVLEALGYEVEVLDAGCCGLAGSFGFDAHHEPFSHKIGSELWLPKVRASLRPGSNLVMDGFSCRAQLGHLSPELASRTVGLPSLLAQNLRHPEHEG